MLAAEDIKDYLLSVVPLSRRLKSFQTKLCLQSSGIAYAYCTVFNLVDLHALVLLEDPYPCHLTSFGIQNLL